MRYSTYDASGNSFVIFHTNERKDYSSLAIELCKKEEVDGLIVVVPHIVYDFEWLFYNNDGSTATMCGNGTRAVALYANKNELVGNFTKFLTGAGEINCTIDGDIVETQMTKPFEIKEPFFEEGFLCWIVNTGVPHLVIMTDNLDDFNLELCSQLRTKYNANVNFAKVEDKKLFVRTFERGVEGETLACGTGMVASYLRALNLGLVGNSAKVYPKSGEELTIRKEDEILYFKGVVKLVEVKEMGNYL
jgi:diaminopimelate epimerase